MKMNYEDLVNANQQLLEKNKLLENELLLVNAHLKKYTCPTRNKKYYQIHKEEIAEKNKDKVKCKSEISAEKKKEYNRTAYLKRKEQNEIK